MIEHPVMDEIRAVSREILQELGEWNCADSMVQSTADAGVDLIRRAPEPYERRTTRTTAKPTWRRALPLVCSLAAIVAPLALALYLGTFVITVVPDSQEWLLRLRSFTGWCCLVSYVSFFALRPLSEDLMVFWGQHRLAFTLLMLLVGLALALLCSLI